jgi:hypothetical protein
MSRKFLILTAIFLATSAMLAPATARDVGEPKGEAKAAKRVISENPRAIFRATTVKSSKSNASDRMGGGGGGKGAVQLNPQPEPPGRTK